MKINHDIKTKVPAHKLIRQWLARRDPAGYLRNRIEWHYYPRLLVVKEYPIHVDIELSNRCQLKCPMCFRFHRPIANQGDMTFEMFKKIIDEISGKVYSVKFTGRGEPLMNKEFQRFMEYIKDKKFKETALITNGQLMKENIMRNIIDCGMDRVAFSIDGLKEGYEKIRAPVKYEEIIGIVSRLRQLRDEKAKKRPLIRIQSVNTCINDEKEFLNLWTPISDEILFLNYKDYSPKVSGRQQAAYPCPLLYQRMMIHYNGAVPMCINDEYEESVMGDALKADITQIWKSLSFRQARAVHKEGDRNTVYKNCSACKLHN